MSRKMAQSLSPPSSIADIVMNSGTRPPSRRRPMTSRPLRAFAAPDLLARSSDSCTSRWLSCANRLANGSPVTSRLVIAEQLLGAAIDRLHLGVAVEHDHAVGRGIEDVADFAGFRLGVAQRRLEGLLPVVAAGAADAGQHQHQRGFALPRRGEQPRLHRHLIALIGGDGERLARRCRRRASSAFGSTNSASSPPASSSACNWS